MLQRLSRWFLAIFLSLLFVVSNLVVPAASANGNIDFNRRGSLTVHLLEKPVVGTQAHNGTLLNPPPNNNPVADAFIRIHKLNIDLSTSAGWETAQQVAAGTQSYTPFMPVDTFKTGHTDGSGVVVFNDLPVGVYYVDHITTASSGIASRMTKFIVTIPFPSKDNATSNTSWLYDVHAYPKTYPDTQAQKTINDSNAFSGGDTFTWTVKYELPELKQGETFQQLILMDKLDPRLEFVTAVMKLNGANLNFPIVTCPEDHWNQESMKICTAAASTGETQVWGAWKTPDALNLQSGQIVTMEITTKAKTHGEIPNVGYVFLQTSSAYSDQATNEVHTRWGNLDVFKRSKEGQLPLSGAVFEVYKDQACSQGQKVDIPASKLTTGANGKFPAPVLLKAGAYYIKEVTAPAGYVVPPQSCLKIDVEANHTTQAPAQLTIDNEKQLIPNLPLTGGQGQALLFAVGGGLLVVTVVVAAVRRRKTANI